MIFLSSVSIYIFILTKKSMQAQLKMRVEYEEAPSFELESPFINVLPSEPLEAYKRFDSDKLQAIRKTERIPFPCVRELILMYILKNQEVIDLTHSELLKEKLATPALQQDHAAVNAQFDTLLKERGKLQKFYEVACKYIEKREKLVSNQLRRTISKKYDGNELTSLMGKLNQKKDNELKMVQSKVDEAAKTYKKIDLDKEKAQIQSNYNQDILRLFQEQTPKLERLSEEFHELLENIGWFKLFIEDFEKALVFIISSRQVVSKPNKRAQQRILKEIFQTELQRQMQGLGFFLDHELDELFEWRSKAKYAKVDIQLPQVKEKCKNWWEKLQQNVYELLPDLIVILKSDRESIRTIQTQISRQYCQFLHGYYDAKEVELFYKRESKIEEVLENQRQLLAAHLKRNYSMMVYYSRSPEYMACIEDFRSKSKGYLRDILSRKLQLLDIAINFINKDYDILYRQACDGKSGIKQKILAKCAQLEDGLKENQTILSLLMQSCRRLLNIISK